MTPAIKSLRHFASGSAMAEFLVIALALVPAFLLLALLGRIGDIRQKNIEAARHAAWERVVSPVSAKSAERLRDEVRGRFFSASGDVRAWRDVPLWSDDGGGRLISGPEAIAVNALDHKVPGLAGGVVRVSDGVARLAGASARAIGMNPHGLHEGKVSVEIGRLNTLAEDIGARCDGATAAGVVCLRAHNVILADTGAAASSAAVGARALVLRPEWTLKAQATALRAVGRIPLFDELRRIDIRHVAPDIVPHDRLGGVEP